MKDRIIETERLYLREMTPEDYEALHAVLSDSDNMRHYPYVFDEARVRGWIERNMERCRRDGFGLWAVCLKDTGYPALYSYCKYTNTASYKTAESIGMRFFREFPDEANGVARVSGIRRDGQ